jgi:hypothetical protein
MDFRQLTGNARVNMAAIGIGAGYGLFFRLPLAIPALGSTVRNAYLVMTWGFLFGVPFVMGYLTVMTRCKFLDRKPPGILYWICVPWAPVILAMLAALALVWEGYICVAFAAPIMLTMASVGGVAAGLTHRAAVRPLRLSAVALLPVVLMLLESHIPDPVSKRTVETGIRIHAPAAIVWQNIVRVPAIDAKELPSSWVRTLGFPRPIEATLSHEGVGGVRNASFTGGLVFTETIDHWDSLRDLSFSIRANTDSIPPTTLDEHVQVGGRYFDVLEGEYRLEPIGKGNTFLHLSSIERVSTHFNPYAGFWTDAVMRSIQNSILQVVKHRAETQVLQSASNGR